MRLAFGGTTTEHFPDRHSSGGRSDMRKGRVRWLFAGSVAAIAVAVALSASAYGSSKAGKILVDGTTETVTNIDPAGNYDYGTATVDYLIFNRLLAAGPGKNLAPHAEL